VTSDPEINEPLKRAEALHRESLQLAAQSEEVFASLKALVESVRTYQPQQFETPAAQKP
jgi:hypothetical protein